MDRFQAAIAVAVLLVAGAAVYVWWQLEPIEEDRGRQRADSALVLERYATVLTRYRAAHADSWPPSIRDLDQFSRTLSDESLHLGWASRAVIGAGTYRYRPPAEPNPGGYLTTVTAHAPSTKAHPAPRLVAGRYSTASRRMASTWLAGFAPCADMAQDLSIHDD